MLIYSIFPTGKQGLVVPQRGCAEGLPPALGVTGACLIPAARQSSGPVMARKLECWKALNKAAPSQPVYRAER